MTQEQLDEVMRRLKGMDPVEFKISAVEAFCMVCALQLALKHPGFQGMARGATEAMCANLGQLLASGDADVLEALEMGYRLDRQQQSRAE